MQLMTGLALAMLGVLFALQNAGSVRVDIFFWQFSSSLALVLLMAAALGAAAMGLISTPAAVRKMWRGSRQQKRITELEKQLAERDKTIADLLQQVPKVISEAKPVGPFVGMRQLIGRAGGPTGLDGPAGGNSGQLPPPI